MSLGNFTKWIRRSTEILKGSFIRHLLSHDNYKLTSLFIATFRTRSVGNISTTVVASDYTQITMNNLISFRAEIMALNDRIIITMSLLKDAWTRFFSDYANSL